MAPATTTVKLKRSVLDMIKWMNEEGELASEIRLGAVARPLAALDEGTALEVLSGMMEMEDPVDDPTQWIVEAAKAIAAEQAEAEPVEEPAPAPRRSARPSAEATAPTAKVKLPLSTVQKIKQLNESGKLQACLDIAEVAEGLSLISKEAQDQILACLEARAAEIENPVGYVANSCAKKAGKGKGKEAGKGQGKSKGGSKGKDGAKSAKGGAASEAKLPVLTASEQKALRKVNFINSRHQLESPLRFMTLKTAFDKVDEKAQMQILDNLHEKLEEGQIHIANPTTWVIRACERRAEKFTAILQERKELKRQEREAAWAEAEQRPKKKSKAAAALAQEEWAEGEAQEEDWEEE